MLYLIKRVSPTLLDRVQRIRLKKRKQHTAEMGDWLSNSVAAPELGIAEPTDDGPTREDVPKITEQDAA